jgi:hypothetical protein
MNSKQNGGCCRAVVLAFTLLCTQVVFSAEQVFDGTRETLYIDGLDPCQPLAAGRMQLKSGSTLIDADNRRTSMVQSVGIIVGSVCQATLEARVEFVSEAGVLLQCLHMTRTQSGGGAWQVKSCTVPISSFGVGFWLEVVLVLGLLALAFALFRWASSTRADAWLQLPTSISSIAQVLFNVAETTAAKRGSTVQPDKRGMVVIAGDELSLRFKVPVYPGVFNHNGSLARCVMAHVPVPPGMIARVETQSGSVSMNRILDTGRVLTIKEENLDEKWVSVLALERSARWQVTVKNGVKTGDDYLVRLHLAVHSSIVISAGDPVIDRVFEEYSSYRIEVSRWVRNALEGMLQEQSYDQSLRHCDEIVDSLNRKWRTASEGRLSSELQKAVTTRFTALVIKPRQEGEATRFRPIFNRIHLIEKETSDIKDQADYQVEELKTKIIDKIQEINTYIGNLDGIEVRVENGQPIGEKRKKSFADRLTDNATAVGSHLDRGAERTEVHKITRSPFEDGASLLKNFGKSYVDACGQLSELIRQVRAEQRTALNSLEQLDKSADVSRENHS